MSTNEMCAQYTDNQNTTPINAEAFYNNIPDYTGAAYQNSPFLGIAETAAMPPAAFAEFAAKAGQRVRTRLADTAFLLKLATEGIRERPGKTAAAAAAIGGALAFAGCDRKPSYSEVSQLPAYGLFEDGSVEGDTVYIDAAGLFRFPTNDAEKEAFYAFDSSVESLAATEFTNRGLGTPESVQVRWYTPSGDLIPEQNDPPEGDDKGDLPPAHFSVDLMAGGARSPEDLKEGAAADLVRNMIFDGESPNTVASQLRKIFAYFKRKFPKEWHTKPTAPSTEYSTEESSEDTTEDAQSNTSGTTGTPPTITAPSTTEQDTTISTTQAPTTPEKPQDNKNFSLTDAEIQKILRDMEKGDLYARTFKLYGEPVPMIFDFNTDGDPNTNGKMYITREKFDGNKMVLRISRSRGNSNNFEYLTTITQAVDNPVQGDPHNQLSANISITVGKEDKNGWRPCYDFMYVVSENQRFAFTTGKSRTSTLNSRDSQPNTTVKDLSSYF